MAGGWTDEQRRVIDLRNKNILVSAAAGSGKTAVLTERILQLVLDPVHPVDIDRMLVLTFTRAAAGEMKSRIEKKLNEALRGDPENRHLRRQTALIARASISTIDSFCQNVVRNHFTSLELDPNFRVIDANEGRLLQEDVLGEVLEEAYEKAEPDFLRFLDSYCSGAEDRGLEDYVKKLATFACTYPDPEAQLLLWAKKAEGAEETERESEEWLCAFYDSIRLRAEELELLCQAGLRNCQAEGGPAAYGAAIAGDLETVQRLRRCETAEEIFQTLKAYEPQSLGRGVKAQTLYKEETQSLRNFVKEELKSLQSSYGEYTQERLQLESSRSGQMVRVLVELTLDFLRRFAQAKRDRNVLDFNDLEHMALQILTVYEDGKYRPSAVARELAESFDEIFIDEYQDSNRLQETLLGAVSGEERGHYNVFRVGDVKQSIYRFRQARPELFMEKYRTYGEEGSCVKVELSRNFRSRARVLEDINRIFYAIMRESMGGIEYDESMALNPGKSFPEHEDIPDEEAYRTELLLAVRPDAEEGVELEARELEAMLIARRIQELTDPESGLLVLDEESGSYHRARYRDIMILLRSFGGWEESFARVLEQWGIPVQVQSKGGYFQTYEIRTTLSYLQVMDNPRQDIPLAAVLLSPYAQFSSEDLARIRAGYQEQSEEAATAGELWDAFCWYAEKGEDTELGERVHAFCEELSYYRSLSRIRNIGDLMTELFRRSGFMAIVSAMPGGEKRRANLQLLLQQGMAYDGTSYRGLFSFIRYIQSLQEAEVDFGEAQEPGAGEDAVRIFTIHKSKGLEFPICFVSALGKSFNEKAQQDSVVLHSDWGLALDYVDPERRLRGKSFQKRCFAEQLKREAYGEEQRILYVAATRAREKLIFTSSVSAEDKWREKIGMPELPGKVLDTYLSSDRCLRDWLGRAHEKDPACFAMSFIPWKLLWEKQEQGRQKQESRLLAEDFSVERQETTRRRLSGLLDYRYPYEEAVSMYGLFTVSELKRRSQEREKASQIGETPEEKRNERPELSFGREKLSAAERGSAYHRVLERLPFSLQPSRRRVEQFLQVMRDDNLLNVGEWSCVYAEDIVDFLGSEIALRMRVAAESGRLHRESRFVIGLEAKEVYPESELAEQVLLQGVIDAWFEEEEGLVLLDYKTDQVLEEGGEELLRSRYRVQLSSYRRALAQMTGKPVRETWLYSFALKRAISLEKAD